MVKLFLVLILLFFLFAVIGASLWNSWNWYALAAQADPDKALVFLFISYGLAICSGWGMSLIARLTIGDQE